MSFNGLRAAVALVMILAACAPRGEIVVDPAGGRDGAVLRSVFVATSRNGLDGGEFGALRARGLSFARYDISVPQDREPGEINWPRKGRDPDPARDFVTKDVVTYPDTAALKAAVRRQLAQFPPASREILIFVHGYNTTFAEGLYRAAQMETDFGLSGAVVHYSWPSAGNPFNYAYDRDSALYARQGLVDLIEALQGTGARRIVIAAHSMGSLLTMEALLRIDLERSGAAARSVQGVALLSPDIDPEVFLSQARELRQLPEDFIILTSRRDRVLELSALMTGQRSRLGNLSNVGLLGDFAITILDTTEFSEGAGHFTAASSPALIEILSSVRTLDEGFRQSQSGRIGLWPATILSVRQVTQVILLPGSTQEPTAP